GASDRPDGRAVRCQTFESAVDGFGLEPHARDQMLQPVPSQRFPPFLIVVDETGRCTCGLGQPGLAPVLAVTEKLENDTQVGVYPFRHASIPPGKASVESGAGNPASGTSEAAMPSLSATSFPLGSCNLVSEPIYVPALVGRRRLL